MRQGAPAQEFLKRSPQMGEIAMSTRSVLRALLLNLMVAVGILGGCGCAAPRQQQQPAAALASKPVLLINLTSGRDDLHAVTMALMAAASAQQAGWPTIVYLNVDAPPLAARDLPNEVALGGEQSVRNLLANAMRSGAKVFVCPHCMQVAGISAENLVPGAKPERIESVLERAGKNIVSLSY
jgi:predicted peroxiredoxin